MMTLAILTVLAIAPSRGADDAGRAIVFSGRVLDPDGQPFSGARLYLSYYQRSDRDQPQPVRATSGSDGRFRFTVQRSNFDRPHDEPWRIARLVALADGYAPGGSERTSDQGDAGGELTVRLVRDDVPVIGRLVDLEGRPVAGATVRIESISAPTGGNLDPWLQAVAARQPDLYTMEYHYIRRLRAPGFDRLPDIPAVTTVPDGRFTVRGIGRERVAELRIEGPTIRTMTATVMTRAGQPVRIPVFGRRRNDWTKTYHPARFELVAPPSRPIEGIVRDRDTGAPIAGVSVRSYRLADLDLGNDQLIRTSSDSSGRFRMTGMPLGKGNEVMVLSPDDQPYLPSRQKLAELTAAGPLHVEFALKRGVWVEGRVTGGATGRPAFAYIRYGAARDNPHLDEATGFSDIFANGDYTTARETDIDGAYRVAALPGRGILTAECDSMLYVGPRKRARARLDRGDFVPYLYGGEPFAEVDIDPSRPAPRCDVALTPALTVEVIVLDPGGRPLSGARVSGQWPISGWGWPLETERLTVFGLAPPRPFSINGLLQARSVDAMASMIVPEKPRTLLLQHEARKLAGWAEVTPQTKGPVEVRLKPWATVTGRLVDRFGEPRVRFACEPQVIGAMPGGDAIAHRPGKIATDATGRFHVEGLVPGLRYRLSLDDAAGVNTWMGPMIAPLKPGEDRAMGDVVARVPGESD